MDNRKNSFSKNSSSEDVGWDEPLTGPIALDYRIIEVNARLSRSSALASKATGYPLAYVAAKLALGYGLTEIKNSVTKKTIACFEPALDYLVVKFPRWDLGKFVKSETTIGSSMQSVGEVMAIGRKFEEAIQKACRMLDIGLDGICDDSLKELDFAKPTPGRLFAIAKSLKRRTAVEKIAKATSIDAFFLEKIKNIVELEKSLEGQRLQNLKAETLKLAKQLGFSDKRLATILSTTEESVRTTRYKQGTRPVVKQIDTLAAEYPAETNYLYLTYNGEKDDAVFAGDGRGVPARAPAVNDLKINSNSTIRKTRTSEWGRVRQDPQKPSVIVLGSGPYRIGSSVEFDWCSVTCAQTVAAGGFDPIIINCNPETVSTDYDMAKKLYFEEISQESVLEIYEKEKPQGVIVSMGGQTPNNLVLDLAKNHVKILGTSPQSIDRAEDRHKFSTLCDQLEIDQPPWGSFKNTQEAVNFADKAGYPVLVRPSYVLSGSAMNVAANSQDLENYLEIATNVSQKYPVVISKFIENAKEIEIDAVSQNGRLLTYAICEHVENAGVHSGDSSMVLPAQKIYLETEKQILKIAKKLSKVLNITGPFNIQFLASDNKVLVIECNLRASRSLPFVSKVTGINFVKLATKAILGKDKLKPQFPADLAYVGVKSPQFSFSRIKGADPILRVEMASTGEVACFGKDVTEAFLKSQISAGIKLPEKSVFISLGGNSNKIKFLDSAKALASLGLKIYATSGTHAYLSQNGIRSQMLHKIHQNKKPNLLGFLLAKKIDLVINITDVYFKKDFDDDYLIRRAAVDYGISLFSNLQSAQLFTQALATKKLTDLEILPWSNYIPFPQGKT